MGYTHYWYKEPEIAAETMRAIIEDFGRLIIPLHDNGVPVAGSDGKGAPEISTELVAFNGLSDCGHPKNSEISIPWPTRDGAGLSSSRAAESGHWFAGASIAARCCNGSCDYESFVFTRFTEADPSEADGRPFDCCKTAFRPYDIAVTAFLLIAKRHLGNRIKVKTDGEDVQWFDAKMLCHTVLGYGLEYAIEKGELLPVAGEEPYRPAPRPAPPVHRHISRDEAIKEIKAALKRRSGRAWSVTGGRGTAWGWIRIGLLPREEKLPEAQRDALIVQLRGLLGDARCLSVPAGSDYYAEYIDRANGRTPSVYGKQYWD